MNDFDAGDFDDNGTLSFAEARVVIAGLTQAEFDLLDFNGDGELSEDELRVAGAESPCSGCFCSGKSTKVLKDFFGDLFLLGLLSIALVAWRGFGVRP